MYSIFISYTYIYLSSIFLTPSFLSLAAGHGGSDPKRWTDAISVAHRATSSSQLRHAPGENSACMCVRACVLKSVCWCTCVCLLCLAAGKLLYQTRSVTPDLPIVHQHTAQRLHVHTLCNFPGSVVVLNDLYGVMLSVRSQMLRLWSLLRVLVGFDKATRTCPANT